MNKILLLAFLTGFLGTASFLFSLERGNLLLPAHAGPPQGQENSQPGKAPSEPSGGVGSQEVPRGDGGKDRVYYSVTTPEEEKKAREEEREKEEKSWEMLRNIIIDRRTR